MQSFPKKLKNRIGDVCNNLVVKGYSHKKNTNHYIICHCLACGNDSHVVGLSAFVAKRVYSCGCEKNKRISKSKTKHDKTYSKEWVIWCSMKQRCYDKNHIYFHNYGGKGISVCKEWIGSFEAFYKDLGKCPENYTLERIDSNKNYTKENCK